MNGSVRPLTFSFRTPATWGWEQVLGTWQRLDAAGVVEELWLVDHLAARRPDDRRFDAWSALAALAAVTRRVRLGPLVTPTIFRHPALLAYTAATVDQVSSGRLNIGLGAGGGLRADDAVMGVESWTAAERASRFDEYVGIVDALLRGAAEAIQARYWTRGAAPVRPVQAPRPPFMLAANGPRAMRAVAAHADRWVSLGGQTDSPEVAPLSLADAVERTKQLGATLDRLCTEAGRDPKEIGRAISTFGQHSHPYASDAAFEGLVAAYREVGIDHFALPLVDEGDERYPGFERALSVLIPRLQGT